MERPDAGGGQAVIWHTVRKNWATALLTALAVTLTVTFYTLGQTKIYAAAATIQFDPNPPRPLGAKVEAVVDMGAGSYWDNHEYYETQYKIITSLKTSLAVVNQLGLNHDAAFLANAPPNTAVPQVTVSEEAAAQALRARVRVEPVKDSRLAVVKLEDADPDRAQRLLTVLVDTYISMNLEGALASTTQAVDWLQGQLDHLKTDLETSEMALHEYKEKKNILSVAMDDQSNMLREEMKQLNEALTHVRTRREEIAGRRTELAKVNVTDPAVIPAGELLANGLLQSLRHTYIDAVRDRDALMRAGKGAHHPEVEATNAKIEIARSAVLAEVKNVQGSLDRDLAAISHQEGGLAGLFESARKRAFELNLLEIEYNRLRRAKDNNEKLYALVLERTKESDLSRMLRVNNIRVIDHALRPGGPVRPQVPFNIGVGAFFGLLLGLAAALGRAVIDRTVKTPDDVEKEVGITFIGLLPAIDDERKLGPNYGKKKPRVRLSDIKKPELIVHEHRMSGIAEAARTIRTNLLFMAPDHPFRTLLITSAGPSEGKTTVACCVAIAMAQAGQRVVIIDCDLRKPRLHRIFGKDSKVGVTTALLEESIDNAILPTEVPNLSVISAGPIPPNPAEILHSERFRAFLEQVQGRFDRVILDSPPIVPVTDGVVLSTLVDGTILVVRAFKTSKDLARHALRALLDVGANIAGTVLNAVNLDKGEYKYSQYYYYRRDGYYAEEAPTSAGRASTAPSTPQDQPPAA
ncbi:Capsular polysaccharide synthesis enzyme CpsD, exopolysaccharide synthesis [Minicystis rosea]|nr:Capsular polysaccharide synthesis enzyme CpsD, exopolysaccharide synthesis [Minicystis rosea]